MSPRSTRLSGLGSRLSVVRARPVGRLVIVGLGVVVTARRGPRVAVPYAYTSTSAMAVWSPGAYSA